MRRKKAILEKLNRFVENLENSRGSFWAYLMTIICVIFLRNFLESFSDMDNFWTPVSPLAYFVHYPMFYLCLLLALIAIFHWLTKEKITKITRITLFFFPIILLAPILDLLISGGQGYNISYMFEDSSALINRFVTFSWGYLGRGVSPGIQIELAVALLLTACYLFLKTGQIISVIIGVMVSYIVGFVFGSLPSLITVLWNLTGSITSPNDIFSGDVVLYHFYSFNHKMTLVLFPIFLVELGLWYHQYNKKKFNALLKNLRGQRVLHYLCMLGVGMLIGYGRRRPQAFFESPFPALILIVSACSGVLAWLWAVGVNDLHDVETDKITNHSRPLASGVIDVKEYRSLNLVFLLLSLVAAVLVRHPFLVIVLLTAGLSYIYSAPPFRLKRVPLLSTFILALCSALVCLAGFVLFSADYSFYGFPPEILLTILVAFTLGLTVIDLKDLRGDRVTGTITIPILFGEKKGKMITGVLVLLAYLSVPVILKISVLIPISLFFGIPTYFLINRKQMRETPIFILYYLFLGVTLCHIYLQIRGR